MTNPARLNLPGTKVPAGSECAITISRRREKIFGKNNDIYQLGDVFLMFHQILITNIRRKLWQTVRRIHIRSSGLIEHLNIDETCLNNYKLHLNKKGIAILASNFVNNIVH